MRGSDINCAIGTEHRILTRIDRAADHVQIAICASTMLAGFPFTVASVVPSWSIVFSIRPIHDVPVVSTDFKLTNVFPFWKSTSANFPLSNCPTLNQSAYSVCARFASIAVPRAVGARSQTLERFPALFAPRELHHVIEIVHILLIFRPGPYMPINPINHHNATYFFLLRRMVQQIKNPIDGRTL